MTSTGTGRVPSRRRGWLPVAEAAGVIALTAGHRHVPFSATPFLLLLGWTSLRLRGLRWRDVGLIPPRRWSATLALGSLAGLAMELFSCLVTQPAMAWLTGRPADLADFRPLVGSLELLLLALGLNWPLAAFGEEMVWRGYLMSRVAGLGGDTRGACLLSLLVVNAAFGACHYEVQGVVGMLQAGLDGALLGLLYLGCGRTLAVPIIAHGMSNSLAFVLIYFGHYPGL